VRRGDCFLLEAVGLIVQVRRNFPAAKIPGHQLRVYLSPPCAVREKIPRRGGLWWFFDFWTQHMVISIFRAARKAPFCLGGLQVDKADAEITRPECSMSNSKRVLSASSTRRMACALRNMEHHGARDCECLARISARHHGKNML
jgi:hypothetical protein